MLLSISVLISIAFNIVFILCFGVLFHYYKKQEIKGITDGKYDIELIDRLIIERNKKNIKIKKILKIINYSLFCIIIILIVPLFIFTLINKIHGNVTMLDSNAYIVVASGSMSAKNKSNEYLFNSDDVRMSYQFDGGDVITIKKIYNKDDVKLYDVVCYYNPIVKKNIIHRIVGINDDGTYVMRGDANGGSLKNDQYFPSFDELVGIYNGKRAKKIGIVVLFLQSLLGIITTISILLCFIVIDINTKQINKKLKERTEKIKEAINIASPMIGEVKIYYHEYEYHFIDESNVIKSDINNDEYREKSKKVMIKTIIQQGEISSVDEIKI